MVLTGTAFFDSNVFIRGLVVPADDPAPETLLDWLAGQDAPDCHTAWHCCLEFYAVATRLPVELRLNSEDALLLLESQIVDRFKVHGLRGASFLGSIRQAVQDGAVGGRVYDAHIAAIARQAGAGLFVTENPRHFRSLERHGITVRTASQVVASL